MIEVSDVEVLAISALQHWIYCPRQCGLIHLEQAWDENVHTMRGLAIHKVVDGMERGETRHGVRMERSLPVWSDRLGIRGKVDLVEFIGDEIIPIDYKHGPRKLGLHDDVQVCAYALCLEEMFGVSIPKGAIYHYRSRRRRDFKLTHALREQTAHAIAEVRAMLASQRLPPAIHDARCKGCSLTDICMPEVVSTPARVARLALEIYEPPRIAGDDLL